MKRIPLWIAVLLSAGCASVPTPSPEAPNFLLIISDDHGWKDYGFMGGSHVRTPHIDRLAAEGRAFTRGYVTSSLCSPSLASIVTGRHVHRHGVTGNDPPWPPGQADSPDRFALPAFAAGRKELTELFERSPALPRLLAQRGYISLQTGKWWLGGYASGGFTEGMTRSADGAGRHGDEGLGIGRTTLAPVTEFISKAKRAGRPFFVWYAPMMPHDPHTPPERLLAGTRGAAPSIEVARYWAMVEWFDETVGELRLHLEREGLAGNTVIVYLADNGWSWNVDNPLFDPRAKQSPFDGGLRTPIIVTWPGRVAPQSSDVPVSAVDLMPTILRLAGVEAPEGLDGVSLLDDEALRRRPFVSGAIFTHDIVEIGNPASSLRYRWLVAGNWKLIVSSGLNGASEPPRLFDLRRDPDEWNDLARRQRGRVAELKALLDGWWDGRR